MAGHLNRLKASGSIGRHIAAAVSDPQSAVPGLEQAGVDARTSRLFQCSYAAGMVVIRMGKQDSVEIPEGIA